MKRIFTVIAAIVLATGLCAQAPAMMSYQAVIRNTSNTLVVSTTVGMQVSILQGSSTGTPVYVETQTPTSNANGLVSIEIGGGTLVSGSFATINWANGPYFIKTETDPAGGTNYTITGTSQLLSVPYALYATSTNVPLNINFRSHNSSSASYSSSIRTNIPMDAPDFANNCSINGDSAFVVPENGVYHFDVSALGQTAGAGTVDLYIYKNSTIMNDKIFYISSANQLSCVISDDLQLTAGDIVYVRLSAGGTTYSIYPQSCSFSGFKVH